MSNNRGPFVDDGNEGYSEDDDYYYDDCDCDECQECRGEF